VKLLWLILCFAEILLDFADMYFASVFSWQTIKLVAYNSDTGTEAKVDDTPLATLKTSNVSLDSFAENFHMFFFSFAFYIVIGFCALPIGFSVKLLWFILCFAEILPDFADMYFASVFSWQTIRCL
jgi:hypothetical protein